MKYICNCSFGKDSLAMLLLLLEKGYPIDEVVFYNTGVEFQAILEIRDKILPLLKSKNIKFTELHPPRPFLFEMFEKIVKKRDGSTKRGYGWCGGPCRWGTERKVRILNKIIGNNKSYIGIAFDEQSRADFNTENKLYPLIDWQITEKECLEYCYSKGFYWQEENVKLYDILDRVSCWCCRNKNLKELKNMALYLPKYFRKLIDFELKIGEYMKGKKSLIQRLSEWEKESFT